MFVLFFKKSAAARTLRTVSLPYLPALLPLSLSLTATCSISSHTKHRHHSSHLRPILLLHRPSGSISLSLSSRWSPLSCSTSPEQLRHHQIFHVQLVLWRHSLLRAIFLLPTVSMTPFVYTWYIGLRFEF